MTPDQIATKGDIATLADEVRALRAEIAAVRLQPAPEWLTVPEAARVIGVTTSTIRRKIASGELQSRGTGKTKMVKI